MNSIDKTAKAIRDANMKTVLLIFLLLIGQSAMATASHLVKGHTKKDGAYVQPHRQTNPDQKRANNFSSQGNVNPNTGKKGTQRNENSTPPKYNDSYKDGQGKRLNQLYGNTSK
jgi:hypothetical protein